MKHLKLKLVAAVITLLFVIGVWEIYKGIKHVTNVSDYRSMSEAQLRKLDADGDIEATLMLAIKLYLGNGAPENPTESIRLLEKAAKNGNAQAQDFLGNIYVEGIHVSLNYAKAHEYFLNAANQGYSPAQYDLGTMYMKGQGEEQDFTKAKEWYEKASLQGNADAQKSLGDLYENGRGVAQDYKKAAELYAKAAEQGQPYAQYRLGFFYLSGKGVPRDNARALELLTKSADQGNPFGQEALATMYIEGDLGVPQDFEKAAELLTKAAEQGHGRAAYNLGHMYISGKGDKQNIQKAEEWLQKAEALGYDDRKDAELLQQAISDMAQAKQQASEEHKEEH